MRLIREHWSAVERYFVFSTTLELHQWLVALFECLPMEYDKMQVTSLATLPLGSNGGEILVALTWLDYCALDLFVSTTTKKVWKTTAHVLSYLCVCVEVVDLNLQTSHKFVRVVRECCLRVWLQQRLNTFKEYKRNRVYQQKTFQSLARKKKTETRLCANG